MSELNKPCLIIIDDIDRLHNDEIVQIMKLVRSVADFNNTVYILCFDQDIVSKALTSHSFDGKEYLKKIIQLPIVIPEIDKNIVYDTIIRTFDSITTSSNKDEYHTNEVFSKCVIPFIHNIRDVNNILNRFKIKYIISKHNTDPADLLAISVLEYSNANLLKWIYNNRYDLCGIGNKSISISADPKSPQLIDIYKTTQNTDESYIKFISTLFPCFTSMNIFTDASSVAYHRICSSQDVDNYFTLELSKDSISDDTVTDFLYNDDAQTLANLIVDNINIKGKIGALLNLTITKCSIKIPDNERIKLITNVILRPNYFSTRTVIFNFDTPFYKSASYFFSSYFIEKTDERTTYDLLEKSISTNDIILLGFILTIIHNIPKEGQSHFNSIVNSIINRIDLLIPDYTLLNINSGFLLTVHNIYNYNKDIASKLFHYHITDFDKTKQVILCAINNYISSDNLLPLINPQLCDEESNHLITEWKHLYL